MTSALDLFKAVKLDTGLSETFQVHELLRNAIIAMVLAPGEPIQEKEICARLSIPRPPLRDAILQLASERFVIIEPDGRTLVAAIDIGEVLTGQIVRETFEVRITRLAARHFVPARARDFEHCLSLQGEAARRHDTDEFFALDNAFHKLICEISGVSNSWRILRAATGQLDRVRRLAFAFENSFDVVMAEHDAIYQGLRTRSEQASVTALQFQLDSLFENLRLLRKQHPDVFADYGDINFDMIR